MGNDVSVLEKSENKPPKKHKPKERLDSSQASIRMDEDIFSQLSNDILNLKLNDKNEEKDSDNSSESENENPLFEFKKNDDISDWKTVI